MKLWFDFANTPHVPFFLPILKSIEEYGHEYALTLRDFSQTVPLSYSYNLDGLVIGRHGGRSRSGKALNLINRTIALMNYAKGEKFDIAVSHNSYTHILAGRLTGTKVITLMDYEGQPANHLAFRIANRIIVPQFFPDSSLKKFGANMKKVFKYDGFKEQLYLSSFEHDSTFLKNLKSVCSLPEDWDIANNILVTVRPPAYNALYHRFDNPLFNMLLQKLNNDSSITVILLPRSSDQVESMRLQYKNTYIPSCPLDGKNLVYYSDMVVSAGGTMNREAAVLGTPVFTIFAGILPAVDRQFIKMDRMKVLSDENDVRNLKLTKKQEKSILKNDNLCNEITQLLLN